nr:triosephosphate isomerase [uncultured archaeon]
MNPVTFVEAKEVFLKTRKVVSTLKNVDVVVCPPFVYLPLVQRLTGGKKHIHIGAQNSSSEDKGSYTGEVSPVMLRDGGVEYVILGHSERRALGETNEVVCRKAISALRAGLKIILCIGEEFRDNQGAYLGFLENQIKSSLVGISRASLGNIIIAYEPVFAIGKKESDAMNPRELLETVLYIRKILFSLYGKEGMEEVPVLYGGSVGEKNCRDILSEGGAQGLLVGHASLDTEAFRLIIKIAESL